MNEFNLVTQHLVMTEHLNPNNTIFGGQLLAWLDVDIYIHVANLIQYKMLVTYAMDKVIFRHPGKLGDTIQIFGKVDEVKSSRVTASGKAISFNPQTKETIELIECQITFVALGDNGRPTKIILPNNT